MILRLRLVSTSGTKSYLIISGYLTDLGVIAIPKEVFHGHVYQDGVGFVLHAEFEEKKSPMKEKMQRKKKRRQRG